MTAKEKVILDVIKRIVMENTSFVDPTYGTDKDKIYIDGGTDFLSEEEQTMFKDWLFEIGANIWHKK